jgi:succinate dehydrogenase / fumarate reductase flavoprotein subunit
LRYEDVDTSLVTPRPRLYGLVGAEMIEEAWKERQTKHASNGTKATHAPQPVGA